MQTVQKEAMMKEFITRALAFLTEGIIAPRRVLVPVTIRLKVESYRTRRAH